MNGIGDWDVVNLEASSALLELVVVSLAACADEHGLTVFREKMAMTLSHHVPSLGFQAILLLRVLARCSDLWKKSSTVHVLPVSPQVNGFLLRETGYLP
jgi:hypothetical protein